MRTEWTVNTGRQKKCVWGIYIYIYIYRERERERERASRSVGTKREKRSDYRKTINLPTLYELVNVKRTSK